jgi:cell fate (sporulation/competence/biofilm development) regulator YlbF (YheA/YmcA/DUF963 family)
MEKLNGNLIVEKARSFAKILASSREFQEFHYVQEKLKQNKEAQSLLEQFQRKQREVGRFKLLMQQFSKDLMRS